MCNSASNFVAIEKECKHACFLYNANDDAFCAIKKASKEISGKNRKYGFIGNRWKYLAYNPKPN